MIVCRSQIEAILTLVLLFGSGCACRLSGSGWVTSMEAGLSSTANAQLKSVATNNRGTVFATGWALESAAGNYYWQTYRSLNEGASWTLVDQTLGSTSTGNWGGGLAILCIDDSTVIAVGRVLAANDATAHISIRRSRDNGLTWSTVSTFDYGEDTTTGPRGFFYDKVGNLWIALSTQTSVPTYGFRLLKSSNRGESWTTVYDQPLSATIRNLAQWTEISSRTGYFGVGASGSNWKTYSSSSGLSLTSVDDGSTSGGGLGILAPAPGVITTFGTTSIGGKEAWRIRQTGAESTNFASIGSDYQATSGKSAMPYAGDANTQGVILIAGFHTISTNLTRWLVKISNDLGNSYTISDEYSLTSSGDAVAQDLRFSLSGNAWAVGWGTNSSGVSRSIIRKLSCN